MRSSRTTGVSIAVAAVLAASGCSGGDAGDDKAGGKVAPVELSAWSSEAADRPSGAQLTAFAKAVDELSKGRITVEATYGSPSDGADPDQAVIRSVKSGDVSIGLAAARAFSSEGINSFSALTAPFVIETAAGAAAVVRDEAVTAPMLDALEPAGLTGLGLIPETIRRPFGLMSPVLGPEDYAGKGLRSLRSEETYDVFEALGAKPGFWEGDEMEAKTKDGSVSILESSFALAGNVVDDPAIGTGNVAFFPRTNVLFVNSAAAKRLSDDQRAILESAAAKARDESIAAEPTEAAAATDYCASGGRVVLATEMQRAALRAKVASYVAQLEADPVVKAELAAIRDAVAATPDADPVKACEPGDDPSTGLTPWSVSTDASPIDGTYRVEIIDDDLSAVGVPNSQLPELHGTFTWTISEGTMSFDRVAPNPQEQTHETWFLAFKGNRAMLIDTTPEAQRTSANILWVGTWSLNDSGDLRFTEYQPGEAAAPFDRVWWFGRPLTRLR